MNERRWSVIIILPILAVILGFIGYQSAVFPARYTAKLVIKAQTQIDLAKTDKEKAIATFQQMAWFAPKYHEKPKRLANEAVTLLNQALKHFEALSKAGNMRGKREVVGNAIEAAKASHKKSTQTVSVVEKFIANRNRAKRRYTTLHQTYKSEETSFRTVGEELQVEATHYRAMDHYIQPLNDEMNNFKRYLVGVANKLNEAQPFLPSDDNKTQKGDPNAALKLLKTGESYLKETERIQIAVSERVAYLTEARKNATQRTTEARAVVNELVNYLNSLTSQGWSFSKGLNKAKHHFDEAMQYLVQAESLVKGSDYPEVYGSANKAIKIARKSESLAQKIVQLRQDVVSKIQSCESQLESTKSKINSAYTALSSIGSKHSGKDYSRQENVYNSAIGKRESSQEYLLKAKHHISWKVQNISGGNEAIENALRSVSQALSLAEEIPAALTRLNQAKIDALVRITQAKTAIQTAAPTVNSYREYSSSGGHKFDSAKSHLSNANSSIFSREWADAYEYADDAVKLAEAAAKKCQNGYDEEMARIARAKKAKEDAERAKIAAAKAQKEASERAEAAKRSGSRKSTDGGSRKSTDGTSWKK